MIDQRLTHKKIITLASILGGAVLTANMIVSESRVALIPFIALLLWGWIIFSKKYRAEALIIIVCFSESLFFITDLGLRQRLISDISIGLMLLTIVSNFKNIWFEISKNRSPYTTGILLFFCSILIAQYFGAHLQFGQPMSVGVIVVRKYFLLCSYFFLLALGATKEDCFRFFKYLAWAGALLAILSIIEVMVGGGVVFPHYNLVGQERAGLLRVHVGTFLIVFSAIYSYIKYQTLSKTGFQGLIYLTILIICLYTLIFIVLTRAVFLGLLIVFMCWIPFRFNQIKLIMLSVLVSLMIWATISGYTEQVLSSSFLNKLTQETSYELHANKGNISIRKKGAAYYYKLMSENSPVTGVGFFSDTKFPNNPITRAASLYQYYIVDTNGISTLIHFGIIGSAVLIFFIFKSFKDVIYIIKSKKNHREFNYEVLYFILIYILCTPTLNNLLVEKQLIYSGAFFYMLSLNKQTLKES